MRSSNTFWSWKDFNNQYAFLSRQVHFQKTTTERTDKIWQPPSTASAKEGRHRTLEFYYKMNLQDRAKDGDGQTVRTWNLHESSQNTFHVTISHLPPRPCLDSSSPSTVLIHWPSMSRALVYAEHSACCYSNSARSSTAPGSLLLLLSRVSSADPSSDTFHKLALDSNL